MRRVAPCVLNEQANRTFGRAAMSTHIGTIARHGAALMLAAVAGCGHFGMGGGLSPQDARIVFHNETLDQADVYASRGGAGDSVRIGTVFPNRADTIVIHA